MIIVFDIPDGCYEQLNNGQFPIQDADRLVTWIKEGISLPKAQNNGFLAVCDSDFPITREVIDDLKNTVFVGNEECRYYFEIVEIIDADKTKREVK